MKKFLLILTALLMSYSSVLAFDFIHEKQNVYYNITNKRWSATQTSPKDIVLRYKMFESSGGFSEYYNNKGKLAIGPFSNTEFINNGDFVGIDNGNLKFVKYIYNNGYFKAIDLDEAYVQTLFPNAKIIKLSDFKNNEYTIYKNPMEKLTYLVLNDTKQNFYKYEIKPAKISDKDVTGLLNIEKFGKITFSHMGDDNDLFPALKIYVKRKKNEK